MIYLFLGDDNLAKDQKIAELKSKILQTNDAFKFDFDLLHANRLSAEDLKKSLIALPAIASKRLVVLRDIEKLSPQNKDLILEFIDKDESCIDLILDANQVDGRSAFMKKSQIKRRLSVLPCMKKPMCLT